MHLFLVSCLLDGMLLYAQDPVAIRYTVEDGLPSNEIYDAYEDKAGNIWFATDHGVSRFDGYTFKNFTKQDGLSDNTVFEFKEDPAGVVWMRCFNGTLSCLVDGKIYPYPYNDRLLKSMDAGFMANFDIDDRNQMYFTIYRRGERTRLLHLLTGALDSLDLGPGARAALIPTGDPLHRIGAVSVPHFALSGFDGDQLECRDGERHWALDARVLPGWRNGRNVSVSIGIDVDVGIYGPTLQRIEGCAITHSLPLPLGSVGLVKDRQDDIWLMTKSGIIRLDDDLQQCEHLFEGEFCMGMLQDRHGVYWVCTTNGVLAVRDLDARLYQAADGKPITNPRRLCIVDDRLYLLHGNNDISKAQIGGSELHWAQSSSSGGRYQYLYEMIPMGEDSLDQLMLAHPDSIAPRVGIEHNEVVYSHSWQLRRGNNQILGTSPSGCWILSVVGGNLHWNLKFIGIGLSCTSILDNGQGRVWIGSAQGLYFLEGGRLARYDSTNALLGERVTDLALLPDGTLAVSTRGHGVLLIHGRQLFQIGEEQGLCSNMCNRLYVGPSGVWVCSNKGLSLLKGTVGAAGFKPAGTIINYTILDGLPSNKVNDVKEQDGRLYVATENGLTTFDGPRPGNALPRAKIELVKVNDRIVYSGEELVPEDAHVQFRFRGEKLTALGNIRYRYKLEGFDLAWRSTTENIADYYNLPPGAYNFRVVASYPGIHAQLLEDRFSFFLPYFLYEQAWIRIGALALLALLSIAVVWRYYQGRQRRLHAHNNRLLAEVKALRSQMRPHFIFNSLNSIQQFILVHDAEAAQVHLGRFAKLMRGMLEASNHEVISIAREIELLQLYLELERLRFGDDFAYVIDLQQGVDWQAAKIPPMLLQPLVENAVWHGLRLQKVDPKVILRFARTVGGTIVCEVEDNGIGRKAAAQRASVHRGKSFGLSNIEDRIRLLNALQPDSLQLDIIDLAADGEARGTLARLTLQIKRT